MIFFLNSCATNFVVNDRRLQKRKYNKGWHYSKNKDRSSNSENKIIKPEDDAQHIAKNIGITFDKLNSQELKMGNNQIVLEDLSPVHLESEFLEKDTPSEQSYSKQKLFADSDLDSDGTNDEFKAVKKASILPNESSVIKANENIAYGAVRAIMIVLGIIGFGWAISMFVFLDLVFLGVLVLIISLALIIGSVFIGGGNNERKTTEENGELKDVVYLKNGSIIRGVIIEQIPNESIKIRTNDGSVFVYSTEEILKILKE